MDSWMQERSKYQYYDENGEETAPPPPTKWYEVLGFLVAVILLPYLFGLFAILFTLGAMLFGFYYVTKYTADNGDLKFPYLAHAGVALAFILATLFDKQQINFGEHAAIIGFSLIFIFVFTLAPLAGLILRVAQFTMKLFISNRWLWIILVAILLGLFCLQYVPLSVGAPLKIIPAAVNKNQTTSIVEILLDDFLPQPYQGNTEYFYNRMDGDRGSLGNTVTEWGQGNVKMTIVPGSTWAGIWLSLNHPIREGEQINFSAILPAPIKQKYQANITGLQVQVMNATPGRLFRLELKDGNALQWSDVITLNGGSQLIKMKLPALNNINHLVLALEQAHPNDYVVIERISFIAQTRTKDTATAAFVWSYGMLLNNWNPETGLVRDKAKDASGEFDAIQATGNLAAATVVARQLGVINRKDAIQIVNKISKTLLNDIPRYHGLLPHWVKTSPDGEYTIVENTEWSSVDTVIAVIGLLEAQTSLGLDTLGTEKLLEEIDWDDLVTDQGISHGYTHDGSLIPYAWDTFGGESWLIQLAYASVKGVAAPLVYPSPPTANGSGFIDELAWLYVPPPSAQDHWGTDWNTYRLSAVESQIAYYPTQDSTACFSQFGLFGLSAGEVPNPHMVSQSSIYQSYGIGGAFSTANDGSALGASIVGPHYSAMIASLRPEATLQMWDWLIANGYFSPLTNVESLAFQDNQNCDPQSVHWNQLKGSWNLALQTLGWGRYLAERNGKVPVLWQAGTTNPLLQKGYALLAPNGPLLFTTYIPQPNEIAMTPICDNTQVACAGKALNMEGSLGTYLPDLRRHLNDKLAWRIKE